MHTKRVGQGVGRVADQRELLPSYCRRRLVPDLVREASIGGNDVNLGTSGTQRSCCWRRLHTPVKQLAAKAAGIKISTDHLPFRVARSLNELQEKR
jgi:hypothetical protein